MRQDSVFHPLPCLPSACFIFFILSIIDYIPIVREEVCQMYHATELEGLLWWCDTTFCQFMALKTTKLNPKVCMYHVQSISLTLAREKRGCASNRSNVETKNFKFRSIICRLLIAYSIHTTYYYITTLLTRVVECIREPSSLSCHSDISFEMRIHLIHLIHLIHPARFIIVPIVVSLYRK